MKKTLLTFSTLLSLVITGFGQTIYTESFTGTTLPTGWADSSPNTSYTLAANDELLVTMVDSVGPQQRPTASSPGDNWTAFKYVFANPVNMAVGCKCITFDIDNTGNQDIIFAVQVQDVNHDGTNNKYSDNTSAAVPAGYVGLVTVNFAGKFENYYGWPAAGGKLDSTNIIQVNFQTLGTPIDHGDGNGPWNEKFKGNFTMDNVTIAGTLAASVNAGQLNIASSKVYPNPVSDMAKVELNLKSASAVKVTLSDVMGKEVMTIADGNFSDLTKEFSVAGLNKGIYTVNYFVDGAAAKAEMLMVK